MFHVPSDAFADKSCSLNLIQLDHPYAIPPSPEISPSSSPASLSCSSISSLKPSRSASEQLQTPIFSFPRPTCRNVAAVTANSGHEHPSQHISCAPMNEFDMPSSREPIIPSVDEVEMGALHWTTGVPYHMMDVFRANPFSGVDMPTLRGLHHTRSTKHILSPDAVEQKKKSRTKRARIQSPPVVPFPSTGPQEMFAYEFRLEVPYRSTDLSSDEAYWRRGDLHPSYSSTRAMDGREHLHIPRPVMGYGSEGASMRSPVEQEVELSFPPRLPYQCPRTASIPPKIRREHHMQPSYPLFSVSPSTHMSSRLLESSNSATFGPRQGTDEYRPQFDERGCNSLPSAVPIQDMELRAQSHRLSAVSADSLVQKPLYACPLCTRGFQLPNGLALHLKWHDRVGNLTTNPTPYLSRRPQERATPRHSNTESGPLEARDVRLTQLLAQDTGQRGVMSGLSSIPYAAPQEVNLAPAESVSKPLERRLPFVAMANTLL